MQQLVLVDENDNQIGLEEKVACHMGEGILHRAFSVFVFNSKGEILLQQRSKEKLLWPLCWTNTCCSHPFEGEDYQQAGQRRLKEEMGFVCPLEFVGKFEYKARYKDIGSEHELCAVLKGQYDGDVPFNKNEVNNIRWVSFKQLRHDVTMHPDSYTPWFKLEIEKFFVGK